MRFFQNLETFSKISKPSQILAEFSKKVLWVCYIISQKTHLCDKDIKNLELRNKRYFKVGDLNELYIFINPKGTKKFSLQIKQGDKATWYELKEFREGFYNVRAEKRSLVEIKELGKIRQKMWKF